ncbi:response regulator [Leucobacter musarum]|uniref:response regulator n=1 Tax=Leucobacter musarum TaxID=1930747 RepID=UPI0006A7E90A|nr:response regulator transcription factor [Leucobacter musarum]
MIRIVLVDDQAMIRAGIRSILESAAMEIVAEAADGERGAIAVRQTRPDVVLMDLRMPGADGLHGIGELRAPGAPDGCGILVLTTFDGDEEVLEALAAGADGFISKSADPEALIAAVERVARGEATLSPRASRAVTRHLASSQKPLHDPELAARLDLLTARERDVTVAAARGLDNQEIGREMSISPYTVKTHLNRAMAKVDARDRGQLVAFAYRSGLM